MLLKQRPQYTYSELLGWDYERLIQELLSLQRHLERTIDIYNLLHADDGPIAEIQKERDDALAKLDAMENR